MEKSYREGQFVWRELMTSDVDKATTFYKDLLGWSAEVMPMPSGPYTIFKNGETMVGGAMGLPPGAPMPPAWMSYVSVKDVDATQKLASESGGKVLMPAEDIPMVGRIGIIQDPSGGVLGLLRGESGDGEAALGTGNFCWETLNSTDIDGSKTFYTKVIGWSSAIGSSNMLVFSAGGAQIADVEPAPPGAPTHWLLHVVIDKLEAAREKAEKLGAKVLVPVVEIPTVGRISIIADPTGAAISLFESAPRPAS